MIYTKKKGVLTLKKGVFWCVGHNTDSPKLITVCTDCDPDGISDPSTLYSSKSGDNFNHRLEWEKLGKRVTGGLPFDWYPRGRVEIKSGKCTVYLNPDINNEKTVGLILEAFDLKTAEEVRPVCFKSDGSKHYGYLCPK